MGRRVHGRQEMPRCWRWRAGCARPRPSCRRASTCKTSTRLARNGLAELMVDRLQAHAQGDRDRGAGLRADRGHARSGGEITGVKRRPHGHQRGPDAGAAGRVRHDLRAAPTSPSRPPRWPSRAATPHPRAAAPRRCTATWRWALVQAALVEAGLPCPMRCSWSRPPTAPPWPGLIAMPESVDVIIRAAAGPDRAHQRRGGVPVIKHLDGNRHVYI